MKLWRKSKNDHGYYIIPELEGVVQEVREWVQHAEAAAVKQRVSSLDSLKAQLPKFQAKFQVRPPQIQPQKPKSKLSKLQFQLKMPALAWGQSLNRIVAFLRRPLILPSIPRLSIPWPSFDALLRGVKQGLRMASFSLLIFGLGFLTINAQAYSRIMMAWVGQVQEQYDAQGDEPAPVKREESLLVSSMEESAEQKNSSEFSLENLHLQVLPPDARLIIPKLNQNVPIIFTDPQKLLGSDWESLEDTFQEDLKNGVIHYPGTALPGEKGNSFITGHSSYYVWDSGRYKDVFALLHKLKVGDELLIQFEEEQHHYIIEETKQVSKKDVSILAQDGDEKRLTLMTCTPVGTNIRRLVVVAKEVE